MGNIAFPSGFAEDSAPTSDTYLLGSGGKVKVGTLMAKRDLTGTHAPPFSADNGSAGWSTGSVIYASDSQFYLCTFADNSTAVWIRPASAAVLEDHIDDTANPHSVTAAQVGAVAVASHSAVSVVGRSANSTGDAADIAAASNDTFLQRVGNALTWAGLTIGMVADRLLTWAKMPAGSALSVVGRSANSSGDVADIAAGSDGDVLRRSGATLGFGAISAAGHGAQTDGSLHAAATTSVAGFMSAADKLRLEMLDPLATFPSYGNVKGLFQGYGCTDFEITGSGTSPFVLTATGAGSATNWVAAPAGRVGIISMDTGTSGAGVVAMYGMNAGILFGGGTHRFRADVWIPTASDGTNTFVVRVGFNDTHASGGNGTDGVFFRYSDLVNSGQWVCVTRSNSVETTTNTSVAGVPSDYQSLEIEVNAAGSSVDFRIAGVNVATHTTNIPTGAGRETGISTHIVQSAGGTSRSLRIDLQGHRFERTAMV